jgi:nucleotide-binding universal stress UspA family protein
MVVRGPERHPRGVVLAAIDVAERTDEVVNFAFAEARFRSATLRAVTAVDAVETAEIRMLVGSAGTAPAPRPAAVADAQAELDRILADRQARCARVRAVGASVDGPPSAVLVGAATQADVVVTGARRRDGERHGVRLGSVTRALLSHTACPVIVVPHA